MKLKVTFTLTHMDKEFECECFDFENGLLKVVKPTGDDAPSEIYLPLAKIDMIFNYGEPRKKEASETK